MQKKLLIALLALIPSVSANSTVYRDASLDYFWVPGNVLLFHLDYPWDFVLYAFAIYGAYRFVKFAVLDLPVILLNGWD